MIFKPVRISRTRLIHAPAEQVFKFINDPRLIEKWNPFSEGDSSLKMNYSGPAEGVGASWDWEGKRAGAGKATIISSEVNKRVALRLEFRRPFRATNEGSYSLTSESGSSTAVTWTINETALVPRVLNIFVSLDKIVGKQFEKGLLKLQSLAEKS